MFRFNGRHCSEFGIVAKSGERGLLPEPKLITEEIPGRDGEVDFSEWNPDGRTKYKPRTIEIECGYKCNDSKLIRIKAHDIAAWLACGEKRLELDDEPTVFYLARVINRLDIETQIGRIGRFTLLFQCRPFAFSVVSSDEQIQFGQGLSLGYGYRLDMAPMVFSVVGPVVLNLYNPGVWVKPRIRISGSFTSISLACGGRTLSYGSVVSGGEVVIDCERMQAVKDGKDNVLNYLSGDFLEFENGDNLVEVSGTGLNCTVRFEFNYLYL